MTRINLIPVDELHVKHLVAEYRELPRIFKLVKKAQAKGKSLKDYDIPSEYLLGKGHITFFYDKLGWLIDRQAALIQEMKRRGYRPNYFNVEGLKDGINEEWLGNWEPTENEIMINRKRINERLSFL